MNKYCGYCVFVYQKLDGAACGRTAKKTRAENTCDEFMGKETYLAKLEGIKNKLEYVSADIRRIDDATDQLVTAWHSVAAARDCVEGAIKEL